MGSFVRALAQGATGIEGTAWATADGTVVLRERESVGSALRRRAICDLRSASLPAGILTLDELYGQCGSDLEIALDVADAETAAAVLRTALAVGGDGAARRTWLIHTDWEVLGTWREQWTDVRLVNRAKLHGLRQGPERRAAQLSAAGIDAVLLDHAEWTGGLTTLFHRFDRLAFASGAKHERHMRELARMGIDAVSTDQVERAVSALGAQG